MQLTHAELVLQLDQFSSIP